MRKGFTLVELSIVLVIIGLLIGGILAAQSMIKTASLQSFVRQVGQYDAAVSNFYTSYGYLPGDNTLFASAGVTVDGNIEDATGGYSAFSGEIARFWEDLYLVGLKNENGSSYVAGSGNIDIGTEIPKAKLSNRAGFIAYGVNGSNYYRISDYSGTTATKSGFLPVDALAVDTKIDNGNNMTGLVQIWDQVSGYHFSPSSPDGICRTGIGALHDLNLSTSTESCPINIRIGASTGDLK